MSVRMKDIAQDLGLSVITVSKALRNLPDVSPKTRARILKRSAELNYRPNLAARSLVTGRTNMIGLVVPDLVHSFFTQLARGTASVLRKAGFTLFVSSSELDAELEKQAIDQLVARRVDVLLIASTQTTAQTFERLEQAAVPYILVDRKFAELDSHFVGVDDERVGYIATSHLLEVGCRRIAHIGAAGLSSVVGRHAGYKLALDERGLSLPSEYIVNTERVDEAGGKAGYDAAKKLIKLKPRPDGIFCYNDPVAMGAIKAILDSGLRIPEDVALIGCGNIHFDDYLRVPLSSVDQQSTALGVRAARLAIRVLDSGESMSPETILLEPQVVVRDSTRRHAA